MKELLDYIIKQLVSKPEDVEIIVDEKNDFIDFVVHVAADDMGAVIGKGGRIANSIRTVVRSSAKKLNKRINIKFE